MEGILIYLKVVAELAKDIHYNLSGLSFIGNHEYVDKVNEDSLGFIDEINEVYYMANEIQVPASKVIMSQAIPMIPDIQEMSDKEMIEHLLKAIQVVLYEIGGYEQKEGELSKDSINDLFGRISNTFSKHYALLKRIAK